MSTRPSIYEYVSRDREPDWQALREEARLKPEDVRQSKLDKVAHGLRVSLAPFKRPASALARGFQGLFVLESARAAQGSYLYEPHQTLPSNPAEAGSVLDRTNSAVTSGFRRIEDEISDAYSDITRQTLVALKAIEIASIWDRDETPMVEVVEELGRDGFDAHEVFTAISQLELLDREGA